MISQSAFRGVRCVVSSLLLAAGAMAFDSSADPVLSHQDAVSIDAAGSEDGAQEDFSGPETRPTTIDRRRLPALQFGEVRFDTGVPVLTSGDPDDNDTANASRNPRSPGANGDDAAHPHATSTIAAWLGAAAPAATPEQNTGFAGTVDSAHAYDPTWGSVTTRPDARDFPTHLLATLAALIIPGVWLFAKMLDRVERLRTVASRSRRRRRRGGRRWSRRASIGNG